MKKQYMMKKLYFNDKLTISQIALRLGVSPQYVSKILNSVEGYLEHKEERKAINKEKHIQQTKDYIKEKRRVEKNKKLDAFQL